MIDQDKRAVIPMAIAGGLTTLPYLSLGMVTAYLRQHEQGALQEHYKLERLRLGGVHG
jgi:hypothetical protein